MSSRSSIALDTPVTSLSNYISRLGQYGARKLAIALARTSRNQTPAEVTVADLLSYLPMRYEDRSHLATISDLSDGMVASLELSARVAGGFQVGKNRPFKKPKLFIFEVSATDPAMTGRQVVIWWFISGKNAHDIIQYNMKRFSRGAKFIAFGRWEWDQRRGTFALRLNKPDELEMLAAPVVKKVSQVAANNEDAAGDDEVDDNEADPTLSAIHVGRRVPVYRKLGDFRSQRLRELMHQVLAQLSDQAIGETLPKELLARQGLSKLAAALRAVHFPAEDALLSDYEQSRSPAHLRLIFEEFFWLALALAVKRGERIKEEKGAHIKISKEVREAIAAVLPFRLTGAQRRAVVQIFNDMQSDAPMNRLLQGDVGSGKTAVALVAMMAAMENGYQTALMVPTEILAEQHARNIKRLLAKTPYRIELLTGSQRAAEKRRLYEALAAGEVHACIGTHALIQEAVAFHKLGLVVIDEQHRFGVMQRAELRARGFKPDVLVMTATPIPRSLAMTLYGDLDVSVIDQMPPGRTPIKTSLGGEDKRVDLYEWVRKKMKAGRQVFVVYPLVEESEKLDLKDATRMYEQLRDHVFPEFSVGLLHGKMKAPDKESIMRRFVAGQIQLLVSTTVIEVGVDVPNATVMIIEHAERFGLSQLHQLRGRVGRGGRQSFCVLLTGDKQTIVAEERLGIMKETNDGFRIAEKDLEIRGPGELMGTRQAGLPEFRVGNLVRDLQILEQARKEAEFYLDKRAASAETSRMVKQVRADSRFGLAAIG
ncbi:MAG: ATP-dependent helicase RecG [Blastocatellia bacterium]|jgi:ATP-dependent DNA helicase RecG|nr:ATP-dependent helicase RecG [Blastocatellia bacterium]